MYNYHELMVAKKRQCLYIQIIGHLSMNCNSLDL